VTSNIGQLISSVSIQHEVGNSGLQQNVATASAAQLPYPWGYFPTSTMNFAFM
jgi:hypothetical protein